MNTDQKYVLIGVDHVDRRFLFVFHDLQNLPFGPIQRAPGSEFADQRKDGVTSPVTGTPSI